MSIKIEVKGSEVNVVRGKHGANEGKTFRIPQLVGYAQTIGERHPQPVILRIPAPRDKDDKRGHYEPGKYRVSADSFYVGNRELRLREHLVLLPEDAPASKCVLRLTVHGTKSAKCKDGTLVTVLDCDAHIPSESYPVSCYVEPQHEGIQPGEYFVSPESFQVENRNIRLIAKPVLHSATAAAKAA